MTKFIANVVGATIGRPLKNIKLQICECKNCHHKFVPTYREVMFATHLATTRHLKCPKCHKRSWAKKVMSK